MKTVIMLSGLPRSGSQVMSSLLNQHPEIYSTATCPVADLVVEVMNQWPHMSAAVVDAPPGQLAHMVQGMIQGAHHHIVKPIVVDKNRWWPRLGHILHEGLGHPVKIIGTVRPITEILASFVLLIEKNNHQVTYVDQELHSLGMPINNKNRCKLLWEKYIQHPYTSLRMGMNNPHVDLKLVSYDRIVNHSQQVMDELCAWMGVPSHNVDLYNLQQMPEHDHNHGGLVGLHDVRPHMARTSPSAKQVLGAYLVDYYDNMNVDFWRNHI